MRLVPRLDQLESIPAMSWDPAADSFEVGLDSMRKFVERQKDARAPAAHFEDGVKLGVRISVRRTTLRKGALPESQIADLGATSPTWRNGALAPWESAPGARKDDAA